MGCKKLNRAKDAVYNDLMVHYAEKDDNASNGDFDYGTFQEADGGNDVVIADWWKPKFERLHKYLDANYPDAEKVWSDTNDRCDDCGKYINTNPTHYGWLPNYVHASDGGRVCQACALNAPTEFIEAYTNSNSKAFMPWFVGVLEERGWKCIELDTNGCMRFETGFHLGQTDDPKVVAKTIEEQLPGHDYVFVVTGTGQFDMSWTAYIKPKEA